MTQDGAGMHQTLASSFSILNSAANVQNGPNGAATSASPSAPPGGGGGGGGRDKARVFVECAEVGPSSATLAVGGKGLELSLWDLETHRNTWHAKNPKPNSLGLVEEKWVTALTHTSQLSPAVVAVGTSSGRIHLFDTSAQRRPVASWEAAESPVKGLLPAGADVADGTALVFASADGALGLADVRQGRLLGKLKGGSGGSIRGMARHPHLPLLATYGFDRYLRVHDLKTRDLKGQIFLKSVGTAVTFLEDSGPCNLLREADVGNGIKSPEEEGARNGIHSMDGTSQPSSNDSGAGTQDGESTGLEETEGKTTKAKGALSKAQRPRRDALPQKPKKRRF